MKYDTSEWKSETVLGRRLFIHNYAVQPDELSGWDIVKTVNVQPEQDVTEKIHICQGKASHDDSLQISIVETADWSQAHESLKLQLEHCMRPGIPHTPANAQKAGDVQYVATAEDSTIPAAVFFTRGNLQITVRSLGEKPVNALTIARRIDARLLKPSPSDSDVRRQLRVMVTEPGKAVRILDKLSEFASGWQWLTVEVPDGEVRRQGDALFYTPATAGDKIIETIRLK